MHRAVFFLFACLAFSATSHAQTLTATCPATQYVSQQQANTGQSCAAPSTDGSVIPTASVCRITTAITLSTSATNVCSWAVPANAVLSWSCSIPYAITAGTLPTVTVGMNASQAPVAANGFASILTSNSSGGSVNGNIVSTSSGNVTIKVGGSVTNGTYQFTTFGLIQGSATAGTFAITALLSSGASGTIPVGGVCTLW